MKTLLEQGTYVVAVSGGIDSVALLHMLVTQPGLTLIVAHFDHGIRTDSADDAEFVRILVGSLGLEYVTKRVELGADASEALARKERYAFLHQIQKQYHADAIVTAHHQDDVIETALINLQRGTKRRGFVSLRSTNEIRRPLLHMTKKQLRAYVDDNKLDWREDSTNTNLRYTRNRIRAILSDRMNTQSRSQIAELLNVIESQNQEIDTLIDEYLDGFASDRLRKAQINRMQLAEAYEIVAAWLRRHNLNFDKKTLERIVVGARTLQNGSQIDVSGGSYCVVTKDEIILSRR